MGRQEIINRGLRLRGLLRICDPVGQLPKLGSEHPDQRVELTDPAIPVSLLCMDPMAFHLPDLRAGFPAGKGLSDRPRTDHRPAADHGDREEDQELGIRRQEAGIV